MINSRSSSKVGLGLVLTSKFKPTYPPDKPVQILIHSEKEQ
jgi:hypothetical protein